MMSATQRTGRPEFLTEAQRLLRTGKPNQAIDKLCIYSDDSSAPVLPSEYFRLRGIAALVLGETQVAMDFLQDAGGMSVATFEEYERAMVAYFSGQLPRLKRNRVRREQLFRVNLRQLILLSQDLPVDPLERLPRWLVTSA